jgi:hypothetical protein
MSLWILGSYKKTQLTTLSETIFLTKTSAFTSSVRIASMTIGMISNLFLRFMWMLSMSPEVVSHLIRPELLSLMIYALEVLRRGMWNFIRVEYKHIEICKEFKVTMNVELPFKKDKEGKFYLKDASILDFVKMNKRLEKMSTMYVDNILNKDIFGEKKVESKNLHNSEISKSQIVEEEFGKKLGSFIKQHNNLTNTISVVRPGENKASKMEHEISDKNK